MQSLGLPRDSVISLTKFREALRHAGAGMVRKQVNQKSAQRRFWHGGGRCLILVESVLDTSHPWAASLRAPPEQLGKLGSIAAPSSTNPLHQKRPVLAGLRLMINRLTSARTVITNIVPLLRTPLTTTRGLYCRAVCSIVLAGGSGVPESPSLYNGLCGHLENCPRRAACRNHHKFRLAKSSSAAMNLDKHIAAYVEEHI